MNKYQETCSRLATKIRSDFQAIQIAVLGLALRTVLLHECEAVKYVKGDLSRSNLIEL